jgi:pimeloyl-ACP methyl ester carboxylesterase
VPPPLPGYRAPGEPDPEEHQEKKKKASSTTLPSFSDVVPEQTRTPAAFHDTVSRSVIVSEGRSVEIHVPSTSSGTPLFFHLGTPFAAIPWSVAADLARRHGLWLIIWSRPGYGTSTRVPGRAVADVAAEADAVLRSLERDRFMALGWSTGGPYALACAALLGDRCAKAAIVSSPAPYDAAGLDWTAGMNPARVDEIFMARHGDAILERFLAERSASITLETATCVDAALGGPLAPEDDMVLSETVGEPLVEAVRGAVAAGTVGWYDDDVALVAGWGVDLSAIRVPVTIWHGREDRQAPPAHAEWLAAHVPGSHYRPLQNDGHVSALVRHLDTIFADLADLADLAGSTPPAA